MLVAQNIAVTLGAKSILRQVELAAEAGQFIGVIGPNGSGKSTLLKCIYRVLKPNSGAVMLDGKALSAYTYKESARKMAVVAQHSAVSFDFTVQDIVLMGRSPHKKALQQDTARDYALVRAALEKVEMAGFEERSYHTLSGGERQRVMLAQALAQQTPYLVLDEPTNHLDIKYQLQLMRLVKNLDVTVLAAVHDLNIAAMYCDVLYVLQDGAIVACGPTCEVLTEELIESVYHVKAQLVRDARGHLHILYDTEDQP